MAWSFCRNPPTVRIDDRGVELAAPELALLLAPAGAPVVTTGPTVGVLATTLFVTAPLLLVTFVFLVVMGLLSFV